MIEFTATRIELGIADHPRPFVDMQPTHLEVHHSVFPRTTWAPARQAAEIHRMHLAKGWNGAFYQVGIDPWTGALLELRGIGHRSTSDAPTALTVVLLGDCRVDRVSSAALDSLAELADAYGGTAAITAHQERAATACPGEHGMVAVRQLRDGVLGDEHIIGRGDSNFVVAGLQIHLRDLGLYTGEVDSYYSSDLEAAVSAFEAQAHLPVDGAWSNRDHQALVQLIAFLETLPPAATRPPSSSAPVEQPAPAPAAQPPSSEPAGPAVAVEAPPAPAPAADQVPSSSPIDHQDQPTSTSSSTRPTPPTAPAPTPADLKLPNPKLRRLISTVLLGAAGIAAAWFGLETELENAAVAAAAVASWVAGQVIEKAHEYTNADIIDRIEKGL